MKTYPLLLFSFFLISLPKCTTDYFTYSTFNNSIKKTENDKKAPIYSEAMAYCNKFNINGFSGSLVSVFNKKQKNFNTNTAHLYLWTIPHNFTYPETNYIQFHLFNIINNKLVFNKSPIYIKVQNDSTSQTLHTITSIGYPFLKDLGNISINQFLKNYSFILQDVNGWQGVSLSVFDLRDKPIETSKILIPPFEANPHIYKERHNKQSVLAKLHPFWNIASIHNQDELFYNKSIGFCQNIPTNFEIPLLPEQDNNSTEKLIKNIFEIQENQ